MDGSRISRRARMWGVIEDGEEDGEEDEDEDDWGILGAIGDCGGVGKWVGCGDELAGLLCSVDCGAGFGAGGGGVFVAGGGGGEQADVAVDEESDDGHEHEQAEFV